jgi:hypothetical protein
MKIIIIIIAVVCFYIILFSISISSDQFSYSYNTTFTKINASGRIYCPCSNFLFLPIICSYEGCVLLTIIAYTFSVRSTFFNIISVVLEKTNTFLKHFYSTSLISCSANSVVGVLRVKNEEI